MIDSKIFVYGTLRKRFNNHHLLASSNFIGAAKTVEKYTMYTSGIPFVAKSPEISHITGELYSVTPETLACVDELESYDPLSPEKSWYVREEIEVICDDGEKEKAFIYFNDKNMGRIICSGDYALPREDDSSYLNYFAYGSNINIERMLERVGEFSMRLPALLHGYKIAFNKNAYTIPPTTYANAMPEKNEVVRGALYKIPVSGLKIMDLKEGVSGNHYYRKEVEVITLNGPVNAFTYFACDEAIIEGVEPASWYRDLCNSPLPCMSNLKL